MRLKVIQQPKNKHTRLVSSVGWTPLNELFSISDDKSLLKWGLDGESEIQTKLLGDSLQDVFVTDMKWLNCIRGGTYTAEVFVVGCSDGSFRIYSSTGRLEKIEKAHNGALISLAWNTDGSSLVTAGEDGSIKQYSRSGNLRSKLAQTDSPIYSVVWSPDQSSILYASGKYLVIKPLQVSGKIVKWRAHEGTIMKVDWNPITNLIVSGSEDRKYKVWDSYGQLLFSSKLNEFSITSVAWSPNGEYFACGSFNTISLCDKTGWIHSRSRTNSGSVLALDWTADGTHLAGGGANGAVIFGQVIDRTLEWKNYEVRLDQSNHVHVIDISNIDVGSSSSGSANNGGQLEELEFAQRVIEMSLGYSYLIIVTTKQCYIYHISNFSTPHIFDLSGGTVNLIMQSSKYFMLCDKIRGIQIYSYEGRVISQPKLPVGGALNPAYLKQNNISLSNDYLAVIDRLQPQQIHLIDVISGKSNPSLLIKHDVEILDVALSNVTLGNVSSGTERKLYFIDRNRDLWLYNTSHPGSSYKLSTMCSSAKWNDQYDILSAITDGKLVFWYYPSAVWIDRDLLGGTKSDCVGGGIGGEVGLVRGVAAAGAGGAAGSASLSQSFGHHSVLLSFNDIRVAIRREDGSVVYAQSSYYPSLLHKLGSENSWIRCTRLCRSLPQSDSDSLILWSILACISLEAGQLDITEIAYSNLGIIDKLQYIQSIKAIPSIEGRNAEVLLYKHDIRKAEDLLLNADLIYRAIKMNLTLFKWSRALEIALKYKTHIDTVLGYRQKYLESLGDGVNQVQETDERFLALRSTQIDWNTINAKIEQEIRKEEGRGTPYRSIMPQMTDEDALANLVKPQHQQQRHEQQPELDGEGGL